MDTTTPDSIADERTIAKIYFDDDDEPVHVDAAFIVEDWDWVIGFDQIQSAEHDYVSIPVARVIGVMSPEYVQFSHNGRRVTGYGITEPEIEEYRGFLPL
jgi:hypothetical protein